MLFFFFFFSSHNAVVLKIGSLSKPLRRPLLYTAAASKKAPKMTHCACLQMTFRRSPLRQILRREGLSFWRSRYYERLKVDSSPIFAITGFKAVVDCFSLYQESVRGFWFSSEYVFLAFLSLSFRS